MICNLVKGIGKIQLLWICCVIWIL